MNDLISRQAALDAIKKTHWFTVQADSNTDYLCGTNNDIVSINVHMDIDAVRRAINDVPAVSGWVSVKDRLPPNADHPGAFCPRYQVITKYGVTEGWYNPDKGCWYTLVWFYLGRKTFDDIDYERGNIPGITDKIEVTHWKEMPEPPKEKNDEHND